MKVTGLFLKNLFQNFTGNFNNTVQYALIYITLVKLKKIFRKKMEYKFHG